MWPTTTIVPLLPGSKPVWPVSGVREATSGILKHVTLCEIHPDSSQTSNVSTKQQILHIVLYQPEIPPNTGNLIRLSANCGIGLHLIKPLGFTLDEKALRRAGLDYHESARVQVHESFDACLSTLIEPERKARLYALTTKGSQAYHRVSYQTGDILLFGPETRGLPDQILSDSRVEQRIRIPMCSESRSLNLSNAAAIVAYEAMRQLEFPGLD